MAGEERQQKDILVARATPGAPVTLTNVKSAGFSNFGTGEGLFTDSNGGTIPIPINAPVSLPQPEPGKLIRTFTVSAGSDGDVHIYYYQS